MSILLPPKPKPRRTGWRILALLCVIGFVGFAAATWGNSPPALSATRAGPALAATGSCAAQPSEDGCYSVMICPEPRL